MGRTALVLGIVALVLLAALWLRGDAERSRLKLETPGVHRAAAVRTTTDLDEPRVPMEASRVRVREVAEEPASQPGSARTASGHETEPAVPRVSGTVVVVDEQGMEHAALDGHFTLMVWKGGRGLGHQVS